jgi:HAD superfamily hydrolase (TIGR01509 family)
MALEALLWDVDGTLAETERDGHRQAFNCAFAEAGLPIHWDAESYGTWLSVSGGHERIHAALWATEGNEPASERVAHLQARKQLHYRHLMESGRVALRPGVVQLIRAADAAGLPQCIVTTSGRSAVRTLVDQLLPQDADSFDFWVCGEDVQRKKPDPEAYHLAKQRLSGYGLESILAIEDSPAGLAAATGGGLACLLSPSHYTKSVPLEQWSAACAVVTELGRHGRVLAGPTCMTDGITLSYLSGLF